MHPKTLLKIALGAICLMSCSQETLEITPEEQYLRDFIKKFGLVSPDQNWNIAVRLSANVDGPTVSGATEICVLTAPLGSDACRLAARYPASAKSFSFDFPGNLTRAYVVAYNADRRIVYSSSCEIKNSSITISRASKSSRAAIDDSQFDLSNPPALGEKVTSLGTFSDAANRFPDVPEVDGEKDRASVFSMYHLDKVTRFDGATWTYEELQPLVGKDGVFPESYTDPETGYCNLRRWEDRLHLDKGVEMVVAKDCPVSLGIMCGGTERYNKYGYIYYSDDKADDKDYIARANRYILIEAGNPDANIKDKNKGFVGSMQVPTLMNFASEGHDWALSNFPLTGSRYYLTYYGEDGTGEPTYTFPAGTHIIFFEIIAGYTKDDPNLGAETELNGENIRYSLPWLNDWTAHFRGEPHGEDGSKYDGNPAIKFVKFGWDDQKGGIDTLVGVEDGVMSGSDDDMNDIMFIVNGTFKNEETEVLKPGDTPEGNDPDAQSWILAIEDLGDTDDYDFNDVVLEISHVSGETTATVRALAAGGTLPVYVEFNGELVSDTHVNSWLGESNTKNVLNVGASVTHTQAEPIKVTVPEDFSMATDNMGGFAIRVKRPDGEFTTIEAGKKAGQPLHTPWIICVDGSWSWPMERVSIEKAYPDFQQWVTDGSCADWWKTPDKGTTVNRGK